MLTVTPCAVWPGVQFASVPNERLSAGSGGAATSSTAPRTLEMRHDASEALLHPAAPMVGVELPAEERLDRDGERERVARGSSSPRAYPPFGEVGATTGPIRRAGGHCWRRPSCPMIARMIQRAIVELPPTGSRGPLRTLLLATDLGDTSEAATEHAIALAAQLSARLLVVTVIDPRPRRGHRPRPVEERERVSEAVHAVAARARQRGANASFLVWDGDPAESIIAAAEAEGADVIVVGSHRRSPVGRAILGSVSDEVVRSAPCPVLVVPPTGG